LIILRDKETKAQRHKGTIRRLKMKELRIMMLGNADAGDNQMFLEGERVSRLLNIKIYYNKLIYTEKVNNGKIIHAIYARITAATVRNLEPDRFLGLPKGSIELY
jgi:hypothetical protein